MFSTFRTLLVAGIAVPLATGFAFAQSAQPTVGAIAPAATAAPAPATTATASNKTTKELGAMKATPAEKKATHEKTGAATPADKTSAVKTAAITPKKHVVKKQTVTPAATTQKADDAAKKL